MSKSKGELQKRIAQQFAERKYPYVDTREGEWGGCVDYEDEIAPILDDAKKEFPKYHRVNDPDFERIFKEKAFVWDDRVFNQQKITEWFEKWFGST
jgi:hypothetical protein